jgi:hypothetical protein
MSQTSGVPEALPGSRERRQSGFLHPQRRVMLWTALLDALVWPAFFPR